MIQNVRALPHEAGAQLHETIMPSKTEPACFPTPRVPPCLAKSQKVPNTKEESESAAEKGKDIPAYAVLLMQSEDDVDRLWVTSHAKATT